MDTPQNYCGTSITLAEPSLNPFLIFSKNCYRLFCNYYVCHWFRFCVFHEWSLHHSMSHASWTNGWKVTGTILIREVTQKASIVIQILVSRKSNSSCANFSCIFSCNYVISLTRNTCLVFFPTYFSIPNCILFQVSSIFCWNV